MIKNFTTAFALLVSSFAFSQVGVNTDAPKSTLDVSAVRNSVGVLTDNTQTYGLQAPRLTRAELTNNTGTYGADQTGSLIYVTDISGGNVLGQRANVTAIGYYYFDGTAWQTVKGAATSPVNIYNANGSLTSDRTLNLSGRELNFVGTEQATFWSSYGILNQMNIQDDEGFAGMALYGGNDSNLFIQQFLDSNGAITNSGTATGLLIGTNATDTPTPLIISTSAGSGASGTEKMRVTGKGNIGINVTIPTEKLDVNGVTRLRSLPLNGTTNAHHTLTNGTESPTQNQTFSPSRTVVADANGVIGYVDGLPSVSNGNNPTWQIGETRSARVVVPASIFTVLSGSRSIMTGRTNTGSTNRRSAYDVLNQQGDTQQMEKFLVINGLRLDFMRFAGNDTNVSPKLFNTNSSTTTYNLSALSTNDSNTDFGANMSINSNHYSYFIDGNDEMSCRADTGRIEYINAMLTFPDGQWYNCTWHATRDTNNYYFYFTAQRLN